MILLCAGHQPEKPGACYGSFCEYEEAVRWVGILAALLHPKVEVGVVPTGSLISKIAFINNYTDKKVDLAVEIHFNSDESKRQRGSETLYCPGSVKGQRVAKIVQDAMGAILTPSRGAKEGWYRMDQPGHVDYKGDIDGDEAVDAFLSQTKPIALILEPEFIYNRSTIEALRQVSCEIIADALIEAVEVIST